MFIIEPFFLCPAVISFSLRRVGPTSLYVGQTRQEDRLGLMMVA
jgi:hypothetical protein